ncbi:energy transducer TonB [Glacieibacterium frigidum]|uniref:TonB C-terminal domain-containing protein n=1 Tax=Glacieibacterium frigidum TaxID=2593303 RepID=A0A552UGD8_9SPHN|nr:energy transducer TonB [Glacieibacterium frigidum]TRW17288.1 hypothetical protein FMM06_03645 [Glacieibacterium frigidum]
MRTTLTALAILAAVPAGAATLQEQYAAAQAAFDAGRFAEARSGFAAILPRLDANPKMKTQAAIVRSRMGTAAFGLGEPEAAVALIQAALPVLDPKSPDWVNAMLELGLTQEQLIDFDGAARSYRAVITATPDEGARLSATIGAARVLTFSDPAAARTYADEALRAGAAAFADKTKRDSYAQLLSLRGRIELNAGQPKAARVWLDKALSAAGGLSTRVSAADVRIRGDLGLAAFFAGDEEATRKYLAYTGAGQLPEQGFELGADMPLPSCAPVGAVGRDDMAVVEFQIANDGRVTGATPVYATSPTAAVEFAQAVRGWSWRPEAAVKLPAFWRQTVRLELRCANRGPAVVDRIAYGSASEAWLDRQGTVTDLPPAEAAALPVLRAELARRTVSDGVSSTRLLPVQLALIGNGVRTAAEAASAVASAYSIATANGAPADLLIYLRLRQAEIDSEVRAKGDWRRQSRESAQALEALLVALDREGLGATRGSALVAVRLASWTASNKNTEAQAAAYRRILATPSAALADGDQLRQVARLGLASIEAAARRIDTARALLAETGLTAEQCSTVPVPPTLTRATVGAADFPNEAMRWGFEGKVRVGYDIDSKGLPQGVRTVVAHPPLVFSEAAARSARDFRYKPAFRDGASVVCGGIQQGISFKIRK